MDTESPHFTSDGGLEAGEKSQSSAGEPNSPAGSLHKRYPWIVFVVPFVAYMLLANIEPQPVGSRFSDSTGQHSEGDTSQANEVDSAHEIKRWKWFGGRRVGDGVYPVMYSVRISIMILIMLLLATGYRQFPFKVGLLSVVVGVVGVVIWIGLCQLDLEQKLFVPLGLGEILGLGERASYNPLAALEENVPWMVGFLLIRFTGLALIVPVIEEFFLRGFLMRYVVDMYWEKVPFTHLNRTSIIIATVYGMLAHPAELLAAAAWFSLITWLMLKTRNIWDCVMAHAVTNFLLGVYVLKTGHWELW